MEVWGIFTTGRILFYNSWKDTLVKFQSHSGFHEWLIHLHSGHYCPYSLVPVPQISKNCETSVFLRKRSSFFFLWTLGTSGGEPCRSPRGKTDFMRKHYFVDVTGHKLHCRDWYPSLSGLIPASSWALIRAEWRATNLFWVPLRIQSTKPRSIFAGEWKEKKYSLTVCLPAQPSVYEVF